MSTAVKTVCDACGKEKQAVNHWFRSAIESDLGLCFWIAGKEPTSRYPTFMDICGQECAVKVLNQWMQKQSAQ